jgi:hypothetical protein
MVFWSSTMNSIEAAKFDRTVEIVVVGSRHQIGKQIMDHRSTLIQKCTVHVKSTLQKSDADKG